MSLAEFLLTIAVGVAAYFLWRDVLTRGRSRTQVIEQSAPREYPTWVNILVFIGVGIVLSVVVIAMEEHPGWRPVVILITSTALHFGLRRSGGDG